MKQLSSTIIAARAVLALPSGLTLAVPKCGMTAAS